MRSRIPKSELDLLARVPLFSQCTPGELREIAGLGTEVEVSVGTELTEEGSPGSEFFLIVEGEAECRARGVTIADLGPGDYFGELALLDGGMRTATVTAVTAMRVSVLTRSEFRSLLETSPSIAWKLLAHLAGLVRDAQATAIY